jgi:hypothetical protein
MNTAADTAAVGESVKARVWVVSFAVDAPCPRYNTRQRELHNCELLSSLDATNYAENLKVR